MDDETVRCWLMLAHLPLEPAALRRLVLEHNSPADILALPDGAWRRAGASTEAIASRRQLSGATARSAIARELDQAQRTLDETGSSLLPLGAPDYPALLAQIYDPPPLLYVKGNKAALQQPQFAIVGSRRCSSGSARAAKHFAEGMSRAEFVVTSGLALGIDAAAHRAALSAGGQTVAVIATGIDLCYPRRHRTLADEICAQGAIVTEFNPGAPPRRERFPMRNRIISGMSVGVLVAEAAQRSGSLITARLALEQNREVFALPHSIYDPGGQGCHQLIRDGAKLTENLDHVLEELGSLCGAHAELQSAVSPLTGSPMWDALGHDPATVDELVGAGLGSVNEVLAALAELELAGYVEQHAGLYQRKV